MEKLWRCGGGMLEEKAKALTVLPGLFHPSHLCFYECPDSFCPGNHSLGDETVLDWQTI